MKERFCQANCFEADWWFCAYLHIRIFLSFSENNNKNKYKADVLHLRLRDALKLGLFFLSMLEV